MKAITNAKIITLNGIIWDGAVTFENGRLVDVDWADKVSIPEGAEIIDAQGRYVAPSLIDIHIHGCPDHQFYLEPSVCCEYFLAHGVTTVLPTLYCDLNLEEMLRALEVIRKASLSGPGRTIGGIYMEGPYMNGHGGYDDRTGWRGPIRAEEYEPLVDAMKGFAKVWAVDPARPGILDFIRYLKKTDPDAILANGHTTATFAQCRAIKKYGVKVQTHFNDSGQAKGFAQGTAGAGTDHFTLHEPDMYAELICDYSGIHVDGDLIKTMIRTKGVERVILISDHAGYSVNYKNHEAAGIGYGPDLNYDNEGFLAGSRMPLDQGVRNVMKHTAYGLAHAIRMGSYNAACLLGIDDEVGSLEPGKKANILIMDDMVNIQSVFLEGELVVQNA